VVFVTAHDRYALQAFDVQAVDFLLKPYTVGRFRAAFARARAQVLLRRALREGWRALERVDLLGDSGEHAARGAVGPGAAHAGAPPAAGQHTERVIVRVGDRTQIVRLADVERVESEGNYLTLHAGRSAFRLRATVAGFEAQLDPARFARAHRRTIVNLQFVRDVQPWFNGDHVVRLTSGCEVRLSRFYKDDFLDRLRRAP
jgi:two-component system LytT family response regulator